MDQRSSDIGSGSYNMTETGEKEGSLAKEGNNDFEGIRNEIERTRSEIGEILKAIQAKLAPETLSRELKERVREATTGRAKLMAGKAADRTRSFVSSIGDTVRNNPVPAALAGLGIGWLIVKRRKALPKGGMSEAEYELESEGRSRTGQAIRQAEEGAGMVEEEMGETIGRMKEKTSGAMGRMKEKTGEIMSTAQERMAGIKSRTREKIDQLGPKFKAQADRTKDVFQRNLKERPLALAAGALALGAALGLSIRKRRRRREEEMIRANEAGSEILYP